MPKHEAGDLKDLRMQYGPKLNESRGGIKYGG